MSLLSVVQAVALKVGLQQPVAAITSADTNVLQIVGFANEAGQELAARYGWQEITNEATFTTVGAQGGILTTNTIVGGAGYGQGATINYNLVPLTGGGGSGAQATVSVTNGLVTGVTVTAAGSGYAVGSVLSASSSYLGGSGAGFSVTVATIGLVGVASQGSITALTGPDFGWVLNDTMWDRTVRRPVYGPKYPAEWQQLQAQFLQGPWWQYRIRGNQVLFTPNPPPGDQIYFEWVSKYWCTSVSGTVQTQSAYAIDTDYSILDERLITLDTLWRYKQAKGLSYSEDFDKADAAIADAMTRNAAKPRLNLGGAMTDIYPAVLVPAGNWGIG
jgi:hypothetical protein